MSGLLIAAGVLAAVSAAAAAAAIIFRGQAKRARLTVTKNQRLLARDIAAATATMTGGWAAVLAIGAIIYRSQGL